MTDRQVFTMTQEQYNELINYIHSAPQLPMMLIGGYSTGDERQARANAAWRRLGDEMGFDGDTARAHPPNPLRFSAIPKEKKVREITPESFNPATTPSMDPPPAPIGYEPPPPPPPAPPPPEPIEAIRSGGGGDYAGGGASGSWSSSSDSGSSSSSDSGGSSSSGGD